MIEHLVSKLQFLQTMDMVGPVIGGAVFILLMSLLNEPSRQKFNAVLVAGAGSAYLNGGLGVWEFPYIIVATIIAFKGLDDYRYICLAWVMHTCWDLLHHFYATPIWHWQEASSFGCAIFDFVIAIWFFMGAPSLFQGRRYKAKV